MMATQPQHRALLMDRQRHLTLVEEPRPEVRRPDEVLVRVHAVGVCGSDLHGYTGHTGRRVPPLVMGHEATGEVVEVGGGVRGLASATASRPTPSPPAGAAAPAWPASGRCARTA